MIRSIGKRLYLPLTALTILGILWSGTSGATPRAVAGNSGNDSVTLSPGSARAGSSVTLQWVDGEDDNPGTSGTVYFDGSQIATFQTNATTEDWTGRVTIPSNAQVGDHNISVEDGDGSSANTNFSVTGCGQTLGQHCTAIWTDRTSYTIGDSVKVCYSVPVPDRFQITDYPPGQSGQVVLSAHDDGTGGCFNSTITPPTGTERVHIDVFDNSGNRVGQADASFQVHGSGCAPNCTPSLTSDKSTYHVGDSIRLCFNPRVQSHIRITEALPNGSTTVLYDQDDDGTGACIGGTAALPAGTRQVHMVDTQGGQTVGQASISFQVVADQPGGVWITPQGGETTSGPLTLSAHARAGSSPIDHVNFTAWWPGLGPQSGPWRVLCSVYQSSGDVYTCSTNFGAIGAPAGQILVSFDVYDQAGGSNHSPNGEHAINYVPTAATPTPTLAPQPQPTPTPTRPPSPTATPTAPAPVPTPTRPATPTPTFTPVPDVPTPTPRPAHHTRYVMLIPGICPSVANFSLFCSTHADGTIDYKSHAKDTFKSVLSGLTVDGSAPHELYYSYCIRNRNHGKWYYPSDTHENIAYAAWELDRQLRAVASRHPDATFDLMAHSLGGVVATYWAARVADQSMLDKIHAVITFDSPLRGNYYWGVGGTNQAWFTGDAWSDILPWSSVIGAIDSSSDGVVAKLPGKVHTISNGPDLVVNSQSSWLPHAWDNKTIWDWGDWPVHHGSPLSNAQAVAWAKSWIES